MPLSDAALLRFLTSVHPYDSLEPALLQELAPKFRQIEASAGSPVYALNEELDGLYLVHTGEVEVTDENGIPVSILGPRNSFGERGLTRGWTRSNLCPNHQGHNPAAAAQGGLSRPDGKPAQSGQILRPPPPRQPGQLQPCHHPGGNHHGARSRSPAPAASPARVRRS